MPAEQRIGLFGGTFDPIHLGHLEMAELAMNELQLDQVRFIPCQISPHKHGSPTPARHRLEMVKLATDPYPWAIVDDCETRKPGPSFSWKTAEALKARYSDAELYWIMGTDQWNTLLTWAEPERLAAAVQFIVGTRDEEPVAHSDFSCHTITCEHPASATQIRNDIANGASNHHWLPPEVAAYIADNELYANSRNN